MTAFEVAHPAAKGGVRARRLSQSAKNMEAIGNQKTTARKERERRRSEGPNHRRDRRHGADLAGKGAGARSRSDGLSSQPLCCCTSRLPSSCAARERAGSGRGGGRRG